MIRCDEPAPKKRKTAVTMTTMTTAQYLGTEETLLPSELAYGVLHVAESPTPAHQRVVRDLTIALTLFTTANGLGEILPAPMDVILDYDAALVVQPDILFVASGRRDIVRDRVHGAPDLAIEVLSPGCRVGALDERLEWFAQYGVRECWLCDLPHRQISVLTLSAGGVEARVAFQGAAPVVSGVLGEVPISAASLFGY
jgi:Uma2 family endonuclease